MCLQVSSRVSGFLPPCKNMLVSIPQVCVYVCVFPPRAHCSHDGLQDKAVAKDEELHGMQENVIYKFIYSFRLMCFNVNYAKKGLLYPSILSWAERFSRASLWLLCSKSCAVASSCS